MTVEARVLGVAVIGSGIVFLDGTIVNVALPSIREDLGADLRGLQWILDAYLVTLTALCSSVERWAIVSDAAEFSSSVWPGSPPRRCCAGRRRRPGS